MNLVPEFAHRFTEEQMSETVRLQGMEAVEKKPMPCKALKLKILILALRDDLTVDP
jgi:hypothetical protein